MAKVRIQSPILQSSLIVRTTDDSVWDEKLYRPFIFLSMLYEQNINGDVDSPTNLRWDIQRKTSDSFAHNSGTSDITILEEGWYRVVSELTINLYSGSSKVNSFVALEKNGKILDYSYSSGFHRDKDNGYDSMSIELFEYFAEGDVVGVVAWGADSKSKLRTFSSGCRFIIEKMNDDDDNESTYQTYWS